MKISEFIASYRKLNNLSQEDFGKRVGVNKQTVSKWENGQLLPKTEKMFEISKVTKTPIHILTDEELLEKRGIGIDRVSYYVGINVLHDSIYDVNSLLYFMDVVWEVQCLLDINKELGGILYVEKFVGDSELDYLDDAIPFIIDSIDFEEQKFTLFSAMGLLSFDKRYIKDISPAFVSRNELYGFNIKLDDEKMPQIQMCFFTQT